MTNRDIGKQVDAMCQEKQRLLLLLGQTDKSGYVYSDTSAELGIAKREASRHGPFYEQPTLEVYDKPRRYKIVYAPIYDDLPWLVINIVFRSGTFHFCFGEKDRYYTVESVVSAFGRYAGVEALQECILQFIVKRSESLK